MNKVWRVKIPLPQDRKRVNVSEGVSRQCTHKYQINVPQTCPLTDITKELFLQTCSAASAPGNPESESEHQAGVAFEARSRQEAVDKRFPRTPTHCH